MKEEYTDEEINKLINDLAKERVKLRRDCVKLQEENKQLKIYKDLYEKLRKQFDERCKYWKKREADFIKELEELESYVWDSDNICEHKCHEQISKKLQSLINKLKGGKGNENNKKDSKED